MSDFQDVRYDNHIMRTTRLLPFCLPLFALACQSTMAPDIVEGDPANRKELIGALAALEGRWGTEATGSKVVAEYHVIAEGTAIRETMFPGDAHEMINMYTLDGNSMVMTHYCAGGNQPHMRAKAIEAGCIAFESNGVSDLKQRDEIYMGEMTLVLKGADNIEQHWTALKNGQPEGDKEVFSLVRIP